MSHYLISGRTKRGMPVVWCHGRVQDKAIIRTRYEAAKAALRGPHKVYSEFEDEWEGESDAPLEPQARTWRES